MKKLVCSIFLAFISLAGLAQGGSSIITGKVMEADSGLPSIQAVIQLLSPKDSAMIKATASDANGDFTLEAKPGDYIVKISTMGFVPICRNIHHTYSASGLDLGTVSLSLATQVLKAAAVSARVEPVKIVEDTVVYNAAAFRIAEDATLEDLLRKIPGMEISGSGAVTLHGKPIKQIYVNGKRFFGNDVKAGLRSLNANMVENVKAYERESDFTRITGIDDGEQEDVLDLTIKKNMLNGFHGSIRGGYGTSQRYNVKGNANKISKTQQLTVSAARDNEDQLPSVSNTNVNAVGNGSNGDRDKTTAGISFSTSKPKTEMSGSLQFIDILKTAYASTASETLNASFKNGETIYTTTDYDNSRKYLQQNGSIKGKFNLEWHPVKRFTLVFKPVLEYYYNDDYLDLNSDCYGSNGKQTYNSVEKKKGGSGRFIGGFSSFATYRFKRKGRSITGYLNLWSNNYRDYVDRNITTHYLQKHSKVDPKQDSIRVIDYVNFAYENSLKETAQISYCEPLFRRYMLQASVQVLAQQSVSERTQYPGGKDTVQEDMSYAGTYNYWNIPITLVLRYNSKKFGWSAGVKCSPQFGNLNYVQMGVWGNSTTSSVYFAPEFSLRFTKSKTEKVNIRYYTNTTIPSLYNLIPLECGVRGLSIHKGNADLQASFRHNLTLSYNRSSILKQNSIVFNVNANYTFNGTTNSSEFNEEWGYRIYVPKNVDGNWYAGANLIYNKTFKDNHFSMSSHTSASYNNSITFLYNSQLKQDELNRMGRFMIRENLEGGYRNEWFEWILKLRGDFTSENSQLRPDLDQTPYNFLAGTDFGFTFPWGMKLDLDFSTLIQRGYAYGDFNKEYYYLNASLAQNFFKKRLTVRLDGHDLLDMNFNMVRTFSATSRSINIYNGTGRYVLLSAVFSF